MALCPLAGPHREETAQASREALQDQQSAGDRYQRLEEINLNTGRAVSADFLVAPGISGDFRAEPELRQHAQKEEQQIQDEINPRLPAHRQ